jgi:hypothetical protein
MPLLTDKKKSRLVTAGMARQERESDEDRDQCNHKNGMPFQAAYLPEEDVL